MEPPMSRADDLAPLLAPPAGPTLAFRQGLVVAWNAGTGANTINVAGVTLTDVPVLATSVAGLVPGDAVALLTWQSAWFILGKIITP
jgi:hypothetical protein